MPECTDAERALLDALASRPSGNVAEARAAWAISRVPDELFNAAVSAMVMQHRAGEMHRKAWDALDELGVPGRDGGNTKAFDEFYVRIEKAAKERIKA